MNIKPVHESNTGDRIRVAKRASERPRRVKRVYSCGYPSWKIGRYTLSTRRRGDDSQIKTCGQAVCPRLLFSHDDSWRFVSFRNVLDDIAILLSRWVIELKGIGSGCTYASVLSSRRLRTKDQRRMFNINFSSAGGIRFSIDIFPLIESCRGRN